MSDLDPSLSEIIVWIEDQRSRLKLMCQLVEATISEVVTDRDDQSVVEKRFPPSLAQVLPVLLFSTVSSCRTVGLLSGSTSAQTKDIFLVCRGIVESSVNICFILAHGEPMAEKARRHALQRSYRSLDRTSKISGFSMSMRHKKIPNPSDVPQLTEALSEFNGKQKNWHNSNMPERLEYTLNTFGIPASGLHRSYFDLYENASEIIHGSYYGALHFLGQNPFGGKRTNEQVELHIAQCVFSNLLSTIECLDACLRCFHARYPIDAIDACRAESMTEMLKAPPFQRLLQADVPGIEWSYTIPPA